jgi:hypothetical protein
MQSLLNVDLLHLCFEFFFSPIYSAYPKGNDRTQAVKRTLKGQRPQPAAGEWGLSDLQ